MLHVDSGRRRELSRGPTVRSDQSIVSAYRGWDASDSASHRLIVSSNDSDYPRRQSWPHHITEQTSNASPNRTLYRHTTTYAPFYDAETTPFFLFHFPRLVFRWFYTFSLFLLMILTTLFIAVTPIDVIVQTSGSSFSGIKVFIVIIVCVVFVIISIFMYLLRIFQNRVALNDIPSKLVYIPGRNDMPKRCYREIEKSWFRVQKISVKAGPLHNKAVIINYPGLAPPDYVQEKNMATRIPGANEDDARPGTMLPPGTCYEDIIRSLGDKFKIDGRILTQIDIPKNLSFREILIYIFKVYQTDQSTFQSETVPDIKGLIEIYERMTFGPDLIEEADVLHFMLEFENLVKYCTDNYNGSLSYQRSHIGRNVSKKLLNESSVFENQSVVSRHSSDTRSRRPSTTGSNFGGRSTGNLNSRYLYYSGSRNELPIFKFNDDGSEALLQRDGESIAASSIAPREASRQKQAAFKTGFMHKIAIGRKDYRERDDPDHSKDLGYMTDSEGDLDDDNDYYGFRRASVSQKPRTPPP